MGNTVGGIAGGLKDYAAVMNCYNQGAVSGGTVGGLFGYVNLYSGYIAGAYSSYLVDAPWYIQTENALIGSHKGMSLKDLESMIENVFYLEQSSADSVGKMLPEELFEDGTVAYLLRNFTYRVNDLDGSIWGQTIGVDPYPVFKDAITGLASNVMAALTLHTYKGDAAVYPDMYFVILSPMFSKVKLSDEFKY